MVPNSCQDTEFPWGCHKMEKKKKKKSLRLKAEEPQWETVPSCDM